MNKRNFILDFAFKSKYNFFACVVALLVLVFSVSSITYSWIEGATSLKINTGTAATVYAGSDMAVKVLAHPESNAKTLSLANYIDPSQCSLAPAKGAIDANNNIVVKFLKDGADKSSDESFRDATTNDISNNYIFFETKIKPNDDISSYKFKEGSSLSVSSLKLGISLLSADSSAILYSKIFTAADVASYPIACSGLTGGTEYILQFRIWNDVDGVGYTSTPTNYNAAINFTLVPQANFTTLYLKDYTNSETAQKLLSGKKVKVIAGSNEIPGECTNGTECDTYTFKNVPADTDSLKSVKFVAYNSDDKTTFATWDLSGTAVAEQSTYNVYGSASATASFGTFGTIKKVTLVDKSAENLLKDEPTVTLTNGTEAYTMYRGTSTTDFSTYVPTSAENFKFSNSTYYAEETTASTSTTPYYYILGESQTTSDGKIKCVGFWSDSAYTAFNNITIKDRSTGRLVEANATTLYASYPDSTLTTVKDKLYKAYYDSAKKEWKLTATNSSFTNNETGMVWTFKAYASSTATDETYSWHIDGRKAQDSTTYTFKSAVTGINASDGTWGLYEVSQINPYILYEDNQKLVSFYGGVASNWASESINEKTVNYINENNKTDGTGDQPAYTTGTYKINSKEYRIAKFVDKPSLDYYLKNIRSFSGVQIGENAQGGKFYGLHKDGSDKVDKTVSPISGTTKLNGSDSSSSSVLNLYNGPVAFSTVTSSATSLLGETLYIEYFICPTGQENSANYYCINPSEVDSSGTKSKYCTTVDSSKTTASSFDFAARQDLKDFIAENGTNYTIKTVLTDGTVYYVADSDYVKFIGEPKKVSVKLESVDNVTATASYEGSAGTSTINEGNTVENISEGTVLTLSAKPVNGYKFVRFDIYDASDLDTVKDTVDTNDSTYTVPEYNIVIVPVVKEQTTRTIYLQNDENWLGNPLKVHIWNSSGSYATWDNDDRENMTLVSGNIWKYDLPENYSSYTNLLFHDGNTKAPNNDSGTEIKVGYIYNNSTNTWSTEPYNPSGTTDPTVTITKPDNATISAMYGSGITITSSGTVSSGTPLTITVTPDDGFTVESITINGTVVASSDITTEDTKAICTYTVTGATEITASVKASSSSTPSSNAIYFKNTVGWTNVYVYFYSTAYWNDNGSGSNNIAAGPIQMTLVDGTTDVYYYNIPEGDSYSIVSFTKDSQLNYSNFHQTEAVYSVDFSISKPLYTPNTTASETRNDVPYYNNGTWSAYSASGDTPGAASKYYLRGELTDWTTGTQMYFKSATDDSTVEVEITPSETKPYSFKLYDKTAEKWIGNNNDSKTVSLNTSVTLSVDQGGDSTISLTAGTKYKFSYVINTKSLTVTAVS